MEFHEAAKPILMMGAEEFEQLKADIKANGLLEPIVLYEGKILDGRNRWLACQEVGVEPRYVQYEGDAPVQYVISKINRRNLTASQKAFIALAFKPLLEEEARKRQLGGLKQYSTVPKPVQEREKGESCDKAGELLGHYNAPQYKEKPVSAPVHEALGRGRSDNKAGEPLGINGGLYALPIKNKILGD